MVDILLPMAAPVFLALLVYASIRSRAEYEPESGDSLDAAVARCRRLMHDIEKD